MAEPETEQRTGLGIERLWALAKHWQYLAEESDNEGVKEAYAHATKQLRQRTGWLQEEIDAQKISENRTETVSVLETFIKMGWIDRYTMVDDHVRFWWTEKGKVGAKTLTQFFAAALFPAGVSIGTLEKVCGWIVEA